MRLNGYFDLWVILRHRELDHELLSEAFDATLQARRTLKPSGIPLGLSNTFFLIKVSLIHGMRL